MKITATNIEILDQAEGRTWRIPRTPVREIVADAHERWMANVAITRQDAEAMIGAPFLEPLLYQGSALLSLCIIQMDRAAPDWAPLDLGPRVLGCALRIACRNRSDGIPAVWVATRSTDHALGRALPLLGFPDISTGLRRRPGLEPGLSAPDLTLEVVPGAPPEARLFADARAFDACIADGVRSFGRGKVPGQWSAIDLIKDAPSRFSRITDRTATLTVAGRMYAVDGLYRCAGGRWRWLVHGAVDARGEGIAGPLPAVSHGEAAAHA